jgi:hypothetical protein
MMNVNIKTLFLKITESKIRGGKKKKKSTGDAVDIKCKSAESVGSVILLCGDHDRGNTIYTRLPHVH